MAEPDDDYFTPEQARKWLKDEIRGVAKATQLRIQEATDLVTDYLTGKLSREEAKDRLLFQYESRWGDSPIQGVSLNDSMTDEQIMSAMDRSRIERQRVNRLNRDRDIGR